MTLRMTVLLYPNRQRCPAPTRRSSPGTALDATAEPLSASATLPTQELETFHGLGASLKERVRVYVGLQSAPTPAARAELAVRETGAKAGGFERKVLVLPGNALSNAVHARWSQLPPDDRPRLVLFAKSLGTAGVEAPLVGASAAASVANLGDRTEGALIVGAPYDNLVLTQASHVNVRPAHLFGYPSSTAAGRCDSSITIHVNQRWTPSGRTRGSSICSTPPILRRSGACRPCGNRRSGWTLRVGTMCRPGAVVSHRLRAPGRPGPDQSAQYAARLRARVLDRLRQRVWVLVAPPDGWTDVDTERLEQFLHSREITELE